MVEVCIWAAAGWDDDVGGIVTADLQNVSRKTLAQNLIHLKVTDDPTLLEDAEVVIAFFDVMRTRRNDLVHGLPITAIDLPMPKSFFSCSARKGKGVELKRRADVSPPALTELCQDVTNAFQALTKLAMKLHWRREYRSNDSLRTTATEQEYVHGWIQPSFETALLRRRLEEVRKKRPD